MRLTSASSVAAVRISGSLIWAVTASMAWVMPQRLSAYMSYTSLAWSRLPRL